MWPFTKSLLAMRQEALAKLDVIRAEGEEKSRLYKLLEPTIQRGLKVREKYDVDNVPDEQRTFEITPEESRIASEYFEKLTGQKSTATLLLGMKLKY